MPPRSVLMPQTRWNSFRSVSNEKWRRLGHLWICAGELVDGLMTICILRQWERISSVGFEKPPVWIGWDLRRDHSFPSSLGKPFWVRGQKVLPKRWKGTWMSWWVWAQRQDCSDLRQRRKRERSEVACLLSGEGCWRKRMRTVIYGWTNTPVPTVAPEVVPFPFLGAMRQGCRRREFLSGGLAWLGCISTVGIFEPALGPQGGGKSLNFQHFSLQQKKENSSNITPPNCSSFSEASPISWSPQNGLAGQIRGVITFL